MAEQFYRNPDHDRASTPEQRAFAKKRGVEKRVAKTEAEQLAERRAAEEALYDEGIRQMQAEETSRIKHNPRLSPGDS